MLWPVGRGDLVEDVVDTFGRGLADEAEAVGLEVSEAFEIVAVVFAHLEY